MDPFYSGLLIGLFAGGTAGAFFMGVLAGGRRCDDEEDAARFRAACDRAEAEQQEADERAGSLAALRNRRERV